MTNLKTTQTRLQGDEYLHEIIQREKIEASLREERDELKDGLKVQRC